MTKIKIVSLFSGIGGFETGIVHAFGRERVEVVFASEIDKYASRMYAEIYGHQPHGDITQIHETAIPDHDLLVGGFPCQSFSVAGKRLGFEEARGTLFFEIARIAKYKQPKVMVLENVKGLISHNQGETLKTIVEILSDIGYRVDFELLNSKYFDAPQNRERIFLVCVRQDLVDNEEWTIPKERKDVIAKAKRKIMAELTGIATFNYAYPKQERVRMRLKDVLEPSVAENYYLSEERTAKFVEKLQERYVQEPSIQQAGILDIAGNDSIKRVYETEGIAPTLTTMGGGQREPKIVVKGDVGSHETDLVQVGYIEKNAQGNRVYSTDGLNPTVASQTGGVGGTGGGVILEPTIDTIGQIEEWRQRGHVYSEDGLMGTVAATDYKTPKLVAEGEPTPKQFSDGSDIAYCLDTRYPCSISPSKVGNGIRTHITEGEIGVYDPYNQIISKDQTIAGTLRTNYSNGNPQIVEKRHDKFRIRKLTPLECLRLQTFPDEYYYIMKALGISNTQIYKVAGNAVTVNVIEALVRPLSAYFD